MQCPKNVEYDCSRKCRLREHGNQITLALTKRSISDEQLAAYIAKICANYCDIIDDLGRSAVHMAASVGRYAVLEWLLNQGAIINGRDFESCSSPLHRAIYYGSIDCAVLLLRWGASLELQDADTRCALQNVCRLCDFRSAVQVPASNELLVWGSNKNYNLGINNEQAANTPIAVDYFRKEHISIETVALGAYHSLFLDKRGYLYAVGHGKGGRLGTGNENSLPTPKKVKLPLKQAGEIVIGISVSLKHSLVLTNRSLVFACGLNEDKQLGIADAGEKLTVFKEVITLRDIGVKDLYKVIARDQYSLAYAEKHVYVWGTNVGQFRLDDDKLAVPVPKMLKLPANCNGIKFVEANNFALVVYTKQDVILLYHNYKQRTLKTPNYEALKSISIVGGDNNSTGKGTAVALKLLMLTQTNVIFLWFELTQTFIQCSFSQIRLTQIDKIFYKSNQVLILSMGDVYRGKCTQAPLPVYQKTERQLQRSSGEVWSNGTKNCTEISKNNIIRIELQRIPNVDRVVDIFCNDDFSSYAALQESCWKYFKPPTLIAEEYTFKKLYHEASEYDAVHDVVLHVDGDAFAGHKFIIYSRARGFRDIINQNVDKHVYIKYPQFTSKMMELIMKFIYTNYLPIEDDLDEIRQSLGDDSPAERSDICLLFLGFVEQFKAMPLANYLKSCLEQQPFYLPQIPDKSKYRFNRLRRHDLPELYDVRILCTGDLELQAHKCILVARLEYFEMMFTHTWAEQTTINLNTVPIEYMEPIIEFLYSSDVEHFRKQNYSESFLYNMIVYCDQFFIERLRKVCEIQILDRINIRKCGDMLDFATMYNCELLKQGCLKFICQNLTRVLTYHSLEGCEAESLAGINSHYRNMFKDVFDYRMITPDAEAIDDELLISFVEGVQIDLDYRMDAEAEAAQKAAVKQKQQQRDNKAKQDLRQYEREAIVSMMELINLSENSEQHENVKPKVLQETQEIAAKLQTETNKWMKISSDRKDQNKKKLPAESALKVQTQLQQEEKPKPDYVPLQKKRSETLTPERESLVSAEPSSTANSATSPSTFSSTPSKAYNVNLSDFTTSPREKLSQKQRKRLTSEAGNANSSWRSAATNSPASNTSSPTAAVPIPNAWGVTSHTTALNSIFNNYEVPTGSVLDPTSFANMASRAQKRERAAQKRERTTSGKTFCQILDEERRQREYYERMNTKSLVLTQIEEVAIDELREFYNADNATDEVITIERKSQPGRPMNFAVWQRNSNKS